MPASDVGVPDQLDKPGTRFTLTAGSGPREATIYVVVRRAETLCQVAVTQGAYRLSGSNCEQQVTGRVAINPHTVANAYREFE